MGLASHNIDLVTPFISSPVLLMGAGAGVNVVSLTARGFQVTAIENCRAMVERARLKRGLDLLAVDARAVPFDGGTFASVVVSTGIVNSQTLYDGSASAVIAEALRVVAPGGSVVVAAFRENRRMEYVFQHLKLAGAPSHNVLFVDAQDLTAARSAFVGHDVSSMMLDHLFSICADVIEDQRKLVNSVADCLRLQGMDPRPYVAQHMGFEYCDLSPSDEEFLRSLVVERGGCVEDALSLPPEDVAVIVARKPHGLVTLGGRLPK
jgi:SAM-dependent methyltransferase